MRRWPARRGSLVERHRRVLMRPGSAGRLACRGRARRREALLPFPPCGGGRPWPPGSVAWLPKERAQDENWRGVGRSVSGDCSRFCERFPIPLSVRSSIDMSRARTHPLPEAMTFSVQLGAMRMGRYTASARPPCHGGRKLSRSREGSCNASSVGH